MKNLLLCLPLLFCSCPGAASVLLGPEQPLPAEEDVLDAETLERVRDARLALVGHPDALAELNAAVMAAREAQRPPAPTPTPLELLLGATGSGGLLAAIYGARPRSRKHLLRFIRRTLQGRFPSAAKSLGSMVGLGSGSVSDALDSALLAARHAKDAPAEVAIHLLKDQLNDPDPKDSSKEAEKAEASTSS